MKTKIFATLAILWGITGTSALAADSAAVRNQFAAELTQFNSNNQASWAALETAEQNYSSASSDEIKAQAKKRRDETVRLLGQQRDQLLGLIDRILANKDLNEHDASALLGRIVTESKINQNTLEAIRRKVEVAPAKSSLGSGDARNNALSLIQFMSISPLERAASCEASREKSNGRMSALIPDRFRTQVLQIVTAADPAYKSWQAEKHEGNVQSISDRIAGYRTTDRDRAATRETGNSIVESACRGVFTAAKTKDLQQQIQTIGGREGLPTSDAGAWGEAVNARGL